MINDVYKKLAIVVVLVIFIIVVVAICYAEHDENGEDPRSMLKTEDHSGSITTTDFYFDDEEYGTWIAGTIVLYRTEQGFEGDVLIKYNEPKTDPYWMQFNTSSDFYMTEYRTDHMHPDGTCSNVNVVTPYLVDGKPGSRMFIDQDNDCDIRDDGTITIHLKSTYLIDTDQNQTEFVVGLSNQDGHHIVADLPTEITVKYRL